MIATYTRSCHCRAVRFEADLDLTPGNNKCNCSICTKTRQWNVIIKPEAFRLLSSEGALREYQFGGKVAHHLVCGECGVRSFARGHIKAIGGDYVDVQVASLDDIDSSTLINVPFRFADGRHNHWHVVPDETRHL